VEELLHAWLNRGQHLMMLNQQSPMKVWFIGRNVAYTSLAQM
jgi:hypothetical protein